MAVPTILDNPQHMYKVDDFIDFDPLKIHDLNNKLFCTFTTLEDLNSLLDGLTSKYKVMYNKIMSMFVLTILIKEIFLKFLLILF